MPGENAPQPKSPTNSSTPRAPWAVRMMDRGEAIIRKLLAPLRPRMSLASGSVLVLLTLFLPLGYESCGPETKGVELLQGQGDWPTFLGITLSEYFGPIFFAALVFFATWTILSTLISFFGIGLHRERSLLSLWFVISGTMSLFLLTDAFLLFPMAADDYGAVGGILILASCLLPGKFWPRQLFLRWFATLAILTAIFVGFTTLGFLQGDASMWFVVGIAAVYALVPIGVWCAGVSGKFAANWTDIRRGLALFYLPALLGNLWFFFLAWQEGVWGFVPCSLGVHLMTLGYMRLAKEGEQKPTGSMAGGS